MARIKQVALFYIQKGGFFSIFFIVRMSYIDSNIFNNSAVVGKTCGIACSALDSSDFPTDVCKLVSRIIRQSGKYKISFILEKNINKHEEDFSEFDNDAIYLMRQILNTEYFHLDNFIF